MTSDFLHGVSIDDLIIDFGETSSTFEGVSLLYVFEQGYADETKHRVVFQRGGQLFENEAARNRYGYEGQWNPRPVSVEDLAAQSARPPDVEVWDDWGDFVEALRLIFVN